MVQIATPALLSPSIECASPDHQHSSHAKQIYWTADLIARFWNYWAARSDLHHLYFSHQFGRGIVRLAQLAGVLNGEVLDYGCGPGLLTRSLLETQIRVAATDLSQGAIDYANRAFAGHTGWQGAFLSGQTDIAISDSSYDVVFCVEAIEHLDDRNLKSVLSRIHRLLRHGGKVVFTTPMNEELDENIVFCARCGSEFHRWQHLRSFSPETLRGTLEANDFNVAFCRGVNLENFQANVSFPTFRNWSINSLGVWGMSQFRSAFDKIISPPPLKGRSFEALTAMTGPHLVAIAVKN